LNLGCGYCAPSLQPSIHLGLINECVTDVIAYCGRGLVHHPWHLPTEGGKSHSMDLLTPSSPGGLPTLSLTWLPWEGLPCLSSAIWCQYPSMLWHCWLGDRKGIRPVKNWMLVCWWWWFDWSFARLIAPVVQLSPPPTSSFASINTG